MLLPPAYRKRHTAAEQPVPDRSKMGHQEEAQREGYTTKEKQAANIGEAEVHGRGDGIGRKGSRVLWEGPALSSFLLLRA